MRQATWRDTAAARAPERRAACASSASHGGTPPGGPAAASCRHATGRGCGAGCQSGVACGRDAPEAASPSAAASTSASTHAQAPSSPWAALAGEVVLFSSSVQAQQQHRWKRCAGGGGRHIVLLVATVVRNAQRRPLRQPRPGQGVAAHQPWPSGAGGWAGLGLAAGRPAVPRPPAGSLQSTTLCDGRQSCSDQSCSDHGMPTVAG